MNFINSGISIRVLISFVLGFYILPASAANCSSRIVGKMTADFHLEVQGVYKWQNFTDKSRPDRQVYYLEYRGTISEKNQFLGEIRYIIYGAELFIDWMTTAAKKEDQLRGKGIGRLLFAEIFHRHPNIKTISGVYVLDNYKEFFREYSKNQNLEMAIKATPVYKNLSIFGYNEIITDTVNFSLEDKFVAFDLK